MKADEWRTEAWKTIKSTPHLVYLILTKRPELIANRLPDDWQKEGSWYENVWFGVSSGCNQTLNKMDTLRRIPCRIRFLSAEPLLEDISQNINLDNFHWVIAGGESGSGDEYLWNASKDWKQELNLENGRRTMDVSWAQKLADACARRYIPFYFKQFTAPKPGTGETAVDVHQFPKAPWNGEWACKS